MIPNGNPPSTPYPFPGIQFINIPKSLCCSITPQRIVETPADRIELRDMRESAKPAARPPLPYSWQVYGITVQMVCLTTNTARESHYAAGRPLLDNRRLRDLAQPGQGWGSKCCWYYRQHQGSPSALQQHVPLEVRSPGRPSLRQRHNRCSVAGFGSLPWRIGSGIDQYKTSKPWRKSHLAIFREINFEGLGVVLEAEGRHRKEDIFSIDRFSLLLLAFLGGFNSSTT